MSDAMNDLEFRKAVVTLLGHIAEDVNEILEHMRQAQENNASAAAEKLAPGRRLSAVDIRSTTSSGARGGTGRG